MQESKHGCSRGNDSKSEKAILGPKCYRCAMRHRDYGKNFAAPDKLRGIKAIYNTLLSQYVNVEDDFKAFLLAEYLCIKHWRSEQIAIGCWFGVTMRRLSEKEFLTTKSPQLRIA